MQIKTDIELTPKQAAEAIYSLDSIQQAEMFEHIYTLYGSDHTIMMQFMCARDKCIERGGKNGNSLAAFQSMFASAFKYMAD